MFENGQMLKEDYEFRAHMWHDIPIQIYQSKQHSDIGFVKKIDPQFVLVNNTFYRRDSYTFVSRPGY